MTPHAGIKTSVRGVAANAEASLVGGTFAKRFQDADFRGEVIFVGSKGAYIETHRSELLGLGRLDQAAHSRMVLSGLDLGMLHAGMAVRAEGSNLVIGDSIALELVGALVWEPESVTPEMVQPLAEVKARFLETLDMAAVLQDGVNLGCAIPMIGNVAKRGFSAEFKPTGSPFLDDALMSISRVLPLSVKGDLDGAISEAMPLIGSGPGLTPSGDDYVGGLLFAAYHLTTAYPSSFQWDAACMERLLAYAQDRTTRISFAALQDLASGQGHEPLHTVMKQLLTGEMQSESMAGISAATRIGSTSGWDMLAGLLTGMLLVYSKN